MVGALFYPSLLNLLSIFRLVRQNPLYPSLCLTCPPPPFCPPTLQSLLTWRDETLTEQNTGNVLPGDNGQGQPPRRGDGEAPGVYTLLLSLDL